MIAGAAVVAPGRRSAQRRPGPIWTGGVLTAYVIYQGNVLDEERYEEYKRQVSPNIAAAGGRYVVRGGDATALEGELPAGRTVVLAFPTRQAALDWYRSEEYTEIRKLRDGAAEAILYVVDGIDQ